MMTEEQSAGGNRLEVNAVTVDGGQLQAELVRGGKALDGFSRADCVAFQGDERHAVMRWKGGDRCPAGTVNVRFYLRRARLYGFEWSTGSTL